MSSRIQPVASLKEYFKDALHGVLAKQRVAVEDQTEQYVVNLLTLFARSEALFEQTADGLRVKPLVVMMSEALASHSRTERDRGLQRLGDVSLFIAGFLARGFARRLVDIDYHIAMGGCAYGTLARALAPGSAPESAAARRARVLAQVFAELAENFQPMVDALNELSETGYAHSHKDILRLYELWLKTGSRRAHALLKRLGVEPLARPAGALGVLH
jgi:hypothetical protein